MKIFSVVEIGMGWLFSYIISTSVFFLENFDKTKSTGFYKKNRKSSSEKTIFRKFHSTEFIQFIFWKLFKVKKLNRTFLKDQE